MGGTNGKGLAKVGVFGIGLEAYCYPGMLDRYSGFTMHQAQPGTLGKAARLLGLEFVAVGETGRE